MQNYRVYEVRTFVMVHESHPDGQGSNVVKSLIDEINNLCTGDLVIVTANQVVPKEEEIF